MAEGSSRGIWLQSARWDLFWLFSGLWLPLLVGVGVFAREFAPAAGRALDGILAGERLDVSLVLLGVIHRVTTTYGVLASPFFAGRLRTHRTKYLWVPLAIVGVTMGLSAGIVYRGSFAIGDDYYGRFWTFFVLANVFVVWEAWHFCAQDFGVLSVYRARAGQRSHADRRNDRWFATGIAFGVFLPLVAHKAAYYARDWDVLYLYRPFQHLDPASFSSAAAVTFGAGLLATVWMIASELRKPNRSIPKVLYYLIIIAAPVLVYTADLVGLMVLYLARVVHHWMVAIGLFSHVNVQFHRSGGRSTGAALLAYFWRFAPVVAITMYWYIRWGPLDLSALALPAEDFLTRRNPERYLELTLIIGSFFCINYLHYYFDWCFYSFSRDPVARERVAPYLLSSTHDDPDARAAP